MVSMAKPKFNSTKGKANIQKYKKAKSTFNSTKGNVNIQKYKKAKSTFNSVTSKPNVHWYQRQSLWCSVYTFLFQRLLTKILNILGTVHNAEY